MASSSNDPDSLVTLHFHDFRVERMRHWWTLLGEDDHADIVGFFGKFPPFMRLQVDRGLLEALASFWDPTHCCFSIGEVDLMSLPMEEYAELLQLDRPFQRDSVLRPEIARPEETWRKANISLDLLTKYFSRSAFPAKLARDFIAGKKGWKKFRINAFKIAFRRERGFRCSAHSSFQLWFCSHLRHFYRLQTPYHFERHTVSQTVNIALPFTGNSRDWASYLLRLALGWNGLGSLALRQFGGVQYPPRLGDLDAVTFDYIPSEDMWRLLSRVEVIWGRSPFGGLLYGQAHHILWCLAPLRVSASTGQPERSLCGVPCITIVWRWRIFAATWWLRGGNVSTLRTMNEFIREQLEISEDAKEQLEETLAEAREQLETEQAERTRVQDELDSLRSYTQALVDPATGRPQDIVALRRALDASEEALTSARTSMGVMRVQISVLQGDNGSSCRLSWTWCMMLLSPMLLGSIRRVSLWSLLFTRLTR
uniref:Aminotransferase-like plant mobile domain-containing protein n=1 Tax=Fagus sylvatica TaxID=28930 RepID=A0A2N9FS55_FAGSY